MSTTKTIDLNNLGNKKNKAAGYAATATASAGLGIAGATAAATLNDDDDIIDHAVETNNEPDTTKQHKQHDVKNEQKPESKQHTDTNNQTTDTQHHTNTQPHHEQQPEIKEEQQEVVKEEEPVAEQKEEQKEEQQETTPQENKEEEVEPVNPDEIAEAIISEEEVDPNDIDVDTIVEFDSLDVVYNVDGESFLQATFHDDYGNQYAMVDIDGDQVFDVITDIDGTPIIDGDGYFISANDTTVDDVEMSLTDHDTYLAADTETHIDDIDINTIADDIIS